VTVTNFKFDYAGLHLFWLLAVKSRDLSQALKKITVAIAEQIKRMANIFTQSGNF
jgi:hypothetical protein